MDFFKKRRERQPLKTAWFGLYVFTILAAAFLLALKYATDCAKLPYAICNRTVWCTAGQIR